MCLLAGLNWSGYSASKVLWNFALEVIDMADVLGWHLAGNLVLKRTSSSTLD
jgi:hypothetical protein